MPKQTHATILWLSGIKDLDAPPFSKEIIQNPVGKEK
jgi:hypothetical protein